MTYLNNKLVLASMPDNKCHELFPDDIGELIADDDYYYRMAYERGLEHGRLLASKEIAACNCSCLCHKGVSMIHKDAWGNTAKCVCASPPSLLGVKC